MTKSHTQALRALAEPWELDWRLLREIAPTKDERRKSTLLHAMAGKVPEKTGNVICRECGGYLRHDVCDRFVSMVEDRFRMEIIHGYSQKECPECETPIESTKPARVIESTPTFGELEEPGIAPMPDEERKTKYEPCGCLFDPGEEMVRGALDYEQLQEDVNNGLFGQFNGRVKSRIEAGVDWLRDDTETD